jgi:hypothetical protein
VGPKRLGLLLIEVFCAVAASHAYGAPEGKRWAAIRNQWMAEIRDVFIVNFSVGIAALGYELMWNQSNQSRFRQVEDSLSNLQLRSIACKQFFRSAQPMFLLAMEGVLHVFRFFCLTVSKAEAISYPSNRLRPHHRLFTTMALSSAEASTIRFRTVSSW